MAIELRIEHADGTTSTLTASSRVVHEDLDEMARAEAVVTRDDWDSVATDVDERSDELYIDDNGTTVFGGRLDDTESQQGAVAVRLVSPEVDAHTALPTPGNLTYQNVDDSTIVTDALDEVDTVSAGTVNTVASGVSYSVSYGGQDKVIRDMREQTGAEITHDGTSTGSWTCGYTSRRGSDRSGSITLGPSESNLGSDFRKQVDELQDVTHLIVLGGEEGPDQREVAVVPDADTTDYSDRFDTVETYSASNWSDGDVVRWNIYENKEVIEIGRLTDIGTTLVDEYDGEPRYLEVEATVYGEDLNLGDTVNLHHPDESIENKDIRVVELKTIQDAGGGERQEVTLSTRELTRGNNQEGKRLDDLQAFNRGFGGFVSREQAGGASRQPVTADLNAEVSYFYPDDVVEELTAEVLVELLPFRAYSAGAAASVTNLQNLDPAHDTTPVGDASDYCQTDTHPDVDQPFYSVEQTNVDVFTPGTVYFYVRAEVQSTVEVDKGGTLSVPYTVENFGSDQGTQDVDLVVDGTTRDTDSSVTVGSGSTATGTLSWTASLDAGSYSASVETDDHSDSFTVDIIATAPNFAVTITDTNAPVNEGDTLRVTAEISETAGNDGSAVADLKIDGTTEDSYSQYFFAFETRTIDFEWDTDTDDAGTHTAKVQTSDDSDSTNVVVGDVIDHEWVHDDGSGSTLADSGTATTAIDGTINGAAWQSGDGSSGTHLEYTRADDDHTQLPSDAKSELAHFANSGEGTLFCWVRPGDVTTNPKDGAARGTILGSRIGTADAGTINWTVVIEDDYSVTWRVGDDTGSVGVVDISSGANAVSQGSWSSIGIREDGSTASLYLGEPDGSLSQVASATLSTSSGDHEKDVQFGIARGGNGSLNSSESYDGDIDRARLDSSDVGEETLQNWHDATKGDYS